MMSLSKRPSWALTFTCLFVLANLYLFYSLSWSHWYPKEPTFLPGSSSLFDSYAYLEVIYPEDENAWPYRVYKSSPFKPPFLSIKGNGGEVADGHLFLAPTPRDKVWIAQALPLIMSQDNDLIFCLEKLPDTDLNTFRPQMVNGTPHITFWQGKGVKGHGFGDLMLLDDEYLKSKVSLNATIISNMPEPPPGNLDFHEQQITDRGTVLVTAYNHTPHDLSPLGGPVDGWVADSLFFEIDMKTNEVVFSWSALDHFDFTKSKLPLPSFMGDGSPVRPFDFFHINSIQIVGDAFLISSRHQWGVYLLSQATGEIIWELNGSGEGGSFGPLPTEAQFRWQHDARAHNATNDGFLLSIFDNHNIPFDKNITSTRGLLFNISMPPDPSVPPVLLRRLEPSEDQFCQSQGNYVADLSNHNQLLGYGQDPVVREYGPTGDSKDIRSEIRFGYKGTQSYRAYKAEWSATPRAWSPSLFAERYGQIIKAYVSWNGATDVEYWNVYAVERDEVLNLIGQAAAYGFETVIEVNSAFNSTECIMVAAVQGGIEVRQSNRACLSVL